MAILGVGNRLRGDDAAGVIAAERLHGTAAGWLILDCGTAPENFTGVLRAFAPDLIVILDAAQIDLPAGSIRVLKLDEIEGSAVTTHSLSPDLVIRYLQAEVKCPVFLVAFQPLHDELAFTLSPPVRLAVDHVVRELRRLAQGS